MESPPRYRVEHRRFGLSPFAEGFADTLPQPTLALWEALYRLRKAGETGLVVIVDQATARDVVAREITPRSAG